MPFETGIPYMITYLATLIFVFLGVYVGAILAFISPEEMKPGKKYLRAFENTVLIFLILLLLYHYGANLILLILLGIASSVFMYFTSETSPINQIAYFLLGIAYYFSTKTIDLFITISALIFLYGLPLGSLYVAGKLKRSKKTLLSDILLNYGAFLVIAMLTNLTALYIITGK